MRIIGTHQCERCLLFYCDVYRLGTMILCLECAKKAGLKGWLVERELDILGEALDRHQEKGKKWTGWGGLIGR